MQRLVTIAVLSTALSASALSATALAQQASRRQRQEARVHFEQATTHYNLGRFEEALTEYTRAYEIFPSPRLLFNIGQCHRSLANHERAIFFIESFLREAEQVSPEERQLADELLAESRAALAARQAEERARNAPPRANDPPTAEEAARAGVDEGGPIAVEQPAGTPIHEQGWFWGVVAGSAVLIGVAIAIGVWAGTQTQLPSGSLGVVDWR
jgi:tetratricopeptide (TPR) repeat protein